VIDQHEVTGFNRRQEGAGLVCNFEDMPFKIRLMQRLENESSNHREVTAAKFLRQIKGIGWKVPIWTKFGIGKAGRADL
jgi:hypothetical protein